METIPVLMGASKAETAAEGDGVCLRVRVIKSSPAQEHGAE
jgi:hypothetical protein